MSARLRLIAIVGAGLLAGAGATVLALSSDHDPHRVLSAVAGVLIGWSYVGTGLFAWARRPANRVGPLMVAVGFSWFACCLVEANAALPFTVGLLVGSVPYAILIHLLLAFPTGRLETRLRRAPAAAAYLLVTVGVVPWLLFEAHPADMSGAPRNLVLVADRPGLANAFERAVTLSGAVLTVVIAALLIRRWATATGPTRRALAPMLWTGALLLGALMLSLTTDAFRGPGALVDAAGIIASLFLLAIPYAYLAGLLGSHWSRASAVGSLVRRLNVADNRPGLREALAEVLRDPSLDLVFKRPGREGWVDAAGQRRERPGDAPGRMVTEIVREGETIGAMVHDPSLGDEPGLLRSAAAAAALALDNERLAAELRARVDELQESRASIIAFGLAERRRLERDLHDGAQQRLVALSLQVNLARARIEDDPATAATLLDRARDELRHALDELRELARGIHPAILTDQGLDAAVAALVERSPVPVRVERMPPERLPPPVEAVAYFVVAESLTNVVKYASAHEASVRVARRNGHAVVEVRDDGVGGADIARGTGLQGLADRVAALDGRLDIDSPPGAGTVVRAELPCASS